MSIQLSVSGSTYLYPTPGELGFASQVDAWALKVSTTLTTVQAELSALHYSPGSWIGLYDGNAMDTQAWARVAGRSDPSYRKDSNGVVYLRGAASAVANDQAMLTLPTGHRPPYRMDFSVCISEGNDVHFIATLGTDGLLFITAEGTVTTSMGVALDGISFATT